MLKAKNTALVLIDVQEKLIASMHHRDQLIDSLRRLVAGVCTLEVPVLWCEQYPEGLGATIPEVRNQLEDSEPIVKTCFSSYRSKKFVKKLDDISPKQVLIAGVESHVCVYQTAVQMAEEGYDVQVVADAVSSRTPENCQLGLARIVEGGGKLTSVEMAFFELLKDSEHEKFREILQIVK